MTQTPNAARVNLIILQGTDWIFPVKVLKQDGSLRDLSAATVAMQIRATYDDTTTVLSLTTANGMISVGTFGTAPNQYNLELNIPKASTIGLADWGAGYYDLEITIGTTTVRAMQGDAVLSREITQ